VADVRIADSKEPKSRHPQSSFDRRASSGYNPIALEEMAAESPLKVLSRAAEVAFSLGSCYVAWQFDDWTGNTGPETVRRRSRGLREALTKLGPVYIKLGQTLASRPDVVRDDYMMELEALQDKVPSFPTSLAMKIVEQDLGRSVHEVYSTISPEPVAAASLGQVYRAKLRQTGEEVAVKVQRPNLMETLSLDMYIFRRVARLFNDLALQKLGCSVTLVVDEFGAKLWEESNYEIEANNAVRFATNFEDDPTVKIPRVFLEYTRKRVLTMEWIEGVKSTDLRTLQAKNIPVDTFIRNGVQAALRQLLEFGLFHGDPHPGNVFAMADGRIAYVDFGNVANLRAAERKIMIRAITHVAYKDYEGLADDFVSLGFIRPGTDVTELVPAMGYIWRDSLGTTLSSSLKDFTFRTVTQGFSRLVYRFPIRVPERFSLVIRALLLQEGICLTLNPAFSVIAVALPYTSQRLLSDPDPAMRRELMAIILTEEEGQPVVRWDRLRSLVVLAKQAREGASIQLETVIVNFFRGLRRDLLGLLASNRDGPPLSKVLRSGLTALLAGDRLTLEEVRGVLEVLGPDLSPELVARIANALVRDSIQDALNSRGVEVDVESLGNPLEVARAVQRAGPQKLWPFSG